MAKIEPVEAVCPVCHKTEIFYLPDEPMPVCEDCGVEMVIKELLLEGKHD